MAYNAVLTAMLVANEWDRFGETRKPLRVTEPRGLQRSTYSASIPLKYGIPVILSFCILHYTISQSVFVVCLTRFFSNGMEDVANRSVTAGYSCIAIIICELHFDPSIRTRQRLTPLSNCTRLHTSYNVDFSRSSGMISPWNPSSFNVQRCHQRSLPSTIARCTGPYVSNAMGCSIGTPWYTCWSLCFHYSQRCHRR